MDFCCVSLAISIPPEYNYVKNMNSALTKTHTIFFLYTFTIIISEIYIFFYEKLTSQLLHRWAFIFIKLSNLHDLLAYLYIHIRKTPNFCPFAVSSEYQYFFCEAMLKHCANTLLVSCGSIMPSSQRFPDA